jgi:hypothetical protein
MEGTGLDYAVADDQEAESGPKWDNSSWLEVLSGVPQGSMLRPILFLVFINDQELTMKQTEILKKFADDMKMYQTVGSAEDREKMLRALESLIEWTEVGHPINIFLSAKS